MIERSAVKNPNISQMTRGVCDCRINAASGGSLVLENFRHLPCSAFPKTFSSTFQILPNNRGSQAVASLCLDGNCNSWRVRSYAVYRNATQMLYTLLYTVAVVRSWSLSWSRRSDLPWHLLCPFRLQLLQRLVTLVLHYSPLLEVCDLFDNQPLLEDASLLLSQHSTPPQKQWKRCTHPTRCAVRLKSFPLRRTCFSCFVFLPYAVHDVILVQACKVCISSLPAHRSLTSVRGYRCAIRGDLWCWRACGRAAEKTHLEVLMEGIGSMAGS